MTKQQSATPKDYIRYWHPRKGGWYHAKLIKLGYKWAIVQDLITNGRQRHRIPVGDVKEAVL